MLMFMVMLLMMMFMVMLLMMMIKILNTFTESSVEINLNPLTVTPSCCQGETPLPHCCQAHHVALFMNKTWPCALLFLNEN